MVNPLSPLSNIVLVMTFMILLIAFTARCSEERLVQSEDIEPVGVSTLAEEEEKDGDE